MKEQEWAECAHPAPMLASLRGKVGERKLRLFAVACCRAVADRLTDERSRAAVEAADRYADQLITKNELRAAGDAAREVAVATLDNTAAGFAGAAWLVARDVRSVDDFMIGARACAIYTERAAGKTRAGRKAARRAQAHSLRCVIGNPFRTVSFNPAWRTADVLALALAAYEERSLPSGELDNARLAVLADALEEVGADQAILDHLRGPGPHTRGCFAVDLILGRE